MYQRILVATDGSKLSKKAVGSAISLASAVGAELVALYVVPRYPANYFVGGAAIVSEDMAKIEQHWTDKGQAVVDAVAQTAQSKGVTAKGVLSRSDLVAEAILSTTNKHKCDLIVMASHGRKGIKRVLLGSETLHVLTHSTLPVLVVR